MKCFILVILACFGCENFAFSQKQDSTMYYFAAHQDDWQLFMSANAWNDAVTSGFHTVFIMVTAGDAGHGDQKFDGGLIPYYQARENGAILSAKFLADVNSAGSPFAGSYIVINGHKILRYVYKNVTSYCLRLPNAHGDGEAYATTNGETLKKLHNDSIKTIKAIDGTATYAGWNDFTNTLLKIVEVEKGTAKAGWINVPETDENLNRGDHSEHLLTSVAAQDAVKDASWLGIRAYVDYYTQNLPPNLNTQQIENAAALHACDVVGMINGGYDSNWNDEHKTWLPMDYFRVIRQPAK